MILVADESVDRQVVHALSASHEVYDVAIHNRGSPDDVVLRIASELEAVLVTADKDFGELVYRQQRVHHGVILTRLSGMDTASKAELVSGIVAEHADEIVGAFVVISPNAVRIRTARS